MKTLMIAALMFIGFQLSAQNYWVVETGKEKTSVVKIYDSSNKLLSEQKFARRIDIKRKKERKLLDRMLKQNNDSVWTKR